MSVSPSGHAFVNENQRKARESNPHLDEREPR
jgi:hypothetical protein